MLSVGNETSNGDDIALIDTGGGGRKDGFFTNQYIENVDPNTPPNIKITKVTITKIVELNFFDFAFSKLSITIKSPP